MVTNGITLLVTSQHPVVQCKYVVIEPTCSHARISSSTEVPSTINDMCMIRYNTSSIAWMTRHDSWKFVCNSCDLRGPCCHAGSSLTPRMLQLETTFLLSKQLKHFSKIASPPSGTCWLLLPPELSCRRSECCPMHSQAKHKSTKRKRLLLCMVLQTPWSRYTCSVPCYTWVAFPEHAFVLLHVHDAWMFNCAIN